MRLSKYVAFGKITSHPGQRDALAQILLEAADLMKAYEGCELYIVGTVDDDPDSVWVTEIFKDAEAHKASLALESVQEIIQRGRPLIVGGEQIKLNPLGGKGL
ncbi:putative quinol monooxygenase [Cohnella silvisoli]|uniref:putative quinol monooxygenase n=1 Tax=Cohnella silvisoli TaxID=2873699 RepID=UPI002814EC32|nr:putative quinol monooxygenase [Cohnella silvisoli]